MARARNLTSSIAVWVLVTLTAVLCGSVALRNESVRAADTQYRLVAQWAQVPPGQIFGGVAGTAFDAKGNLYVFRRAGNIWMFDPQGKFLRVWGEKLAKTPMGLRIDRDGFLWMTDTGAHVVKKYTLDGTLLMTLGKYGVPGDGPDTFNGPSDVVVTANGDIFVADGHELEELHNPSNYRIVKFDKNGKFIKAWGTRGSEPGQFILPDAMVQDSRGRLLVADPTNKRIQIFDTDGKFLEQWTGLGGPHGLYITKNDLIYASDHEGGRVLLLDGRHGGKILKTIEGIPAANSVSADRDGNVYIAATQEHYWATPDSPKTMCCLAKFTMAPAKQ